MFWTHHPSHAMQSATPLMLGATLPLGDWQFWVVSALALLAVLWLARSVLPPGARRKRSGKSTRVSLTIGGKPPEKP